MKNMKNWTENTRRDRGLSRPAGRVLAVSAVLLAVVAFATPANADDRRHDRRNDHRSHERWDDSSDDSSDYRHRARGHARYGYDEPRYHRGSKHRKHRKHGKHGHYRDDRRRGYREQRFSVPARIGHQHFDTYRPYYQRKVYFRPHRHHHQLFHFPVFNGWRYVMRPYYYCEGNLYGNSIAYNGYRGGFWFDF